MNTDLGFMDGTRLWLKEPTSHTVVTLLPGVGCHRLVLRLEVDPAKLAGGCTLVQLGGELYAEHGGGMRWLGSLVPAAVGLADNGVARSADLSVPLTNEQVLALEKERNGQDLQLRIDITAVLPQSTTYPTATTQDTVRVPASTWERQIEAVSRGIFFTVTVPLPLDEGPLAKAAAHLRAADRQITAGEYADAIRETRLAIGDMRDMKVWPKDVTKKSKEQDQAERYGVLLDQLKGMADGYAELIQGVFNQASGVQHQDGALARATWVRADAVALNGMAVSLLHRLAEELQVR
ncbi:hypothetical protein ACIHEI_34190 [Kitasatospora sp. NPDC051984]|uniref:hypothetical protein n=1 Tax=Kitasatospora sp. NPDC051984 TaxID=3364059 RepID=UPI0037C5A4F5